MSAKGFPEATAADMHSGIMARHDTSKLGGKLMMEAPSGARDDDKSVGLEFLIAGLTFLALAPRPSTPKTQHGHDPHGPMQHGPQGPPGQGGAGPQGPHGPGITGPPGTHVPVTW